MGKLGSTRSFIESGYSSSVSPVSAVGLTVCIVVMVLGIKFRWFKQRLNFEPIHEQSSSSEGRNQMINNRNSQNEFDQPVLSRGVFRIKPDEDAVIERPKVLPPIGTRKSSNGTLSLNPTKPIETSVVVINEPVVQPPTPPPLPSVSSAASLQVLTKQREKSEDKKVNFHPTPLIIDSEPSDNEYQSCQERRPTAYVKAKVELDEEFDNFEQEPPKAQPRNVTQNQNEKIFQRNVKASDGVDKLDRLVERRPTGLFEYSDVEESNRPPGREGSNSYKITCSDDEDFTHDDEVTFGNWSGIRRYSEMLEEKEAQKSQPPSAVSK